MLGKLLKYEYKATYKLFLTMYLGLLAMAVVMLINIHLNLDDSFILGSISIIIGIWFALSFIAAPIATMIYIAYRFYKNLFTDEGYLMFTLPVKKSYLVLSKYIVSITWIIGTIAAMVASIALFIAGNVNIADYTRFSTFLLKSFTSIALSDMNGLVFSTIYYAICDILYVVAFLYMALAFGQLIIPKHKILGAVVAYFALQFIQQIFAGIILVCYTLSSKYSIHSQAMPHSYFLVLGTLLLLLAAFWLFLTTLICKKKLNLD